MSINSIKKEITRISFQVIFNILCLITSLGIYPAKYFLLQKIIPNFVVKF